MKNKYVAAVLAFVLGSIGVHKFYLRDPGAGIFYIMLMVMTSRFMPISAILGIIDGMRYLMMSPEDFDKKFNSKYYETRPKVSRRTKSNREYYEVKKAPTAPRSRRVVRNNPFKKSGLKKYKEFEIEEAIDDFMKGLKIEPNDIALHFNLACAYSLLENKEDAFNHLTLAVENGFKDYDKIQSHDDLAFLRIQPEFDDYKEKGYKMVPTRVEKEKEEQRPMDDVLLSQLNRLMELRKKGVLTENEFVFERKKILARD
jgi:TM2 domain-containing membrane protein YozV